MLDLVAVDALLAVSRTGTVHAAAAERGYTPSAVSQQIKRLERELGVQLVDKAGRRLILTDAGRRLVDEGRVLREHIEGLRSRLHADVDPTGAFRIGAFSTAMGGLVQDVVSELRREAPRLDVEVAELDPWDALAAVAAGTLDLAVVHQWEGVGLSIPGSVRYQELFRDTADVLLPADDPLAGREWVTPAEVHDRVWTCTPEGTICYVWFCHMYATEPHLPRIAYRCMEFSSQIEFVARGLAVALVPRLGRPVLPAEVVAVPVRNPVPTRPVGLVWRSSMSEAASVRFVRSIFARRAGSLVG